MTLKVRLPLWNGSGQIGTRKRDGMINSEAKMSEVVVLYEDDPARAALGDHIRVVTELSREWRGLMVTEIMLQVKNHDLPQQVRRIGMTFGEGVVKARQLANQYGITTVFAVNRT